MRTGLPAGPVHKLALVQEPKKNLVDPFSCAPEEVRNGTGLETGAHKNSLQARSSKEREQNSPSAVHNGVRTKVLELLVLLCG